ncbi:hypothetical protein [uncultured Sphingomonas sp.]|uniref:hypothetical protein n=1 Tax=uncultured Sphingomonas sp. TaxID=158754 RepID=UPI0035CAF4FA
MYDNASTYVRNLIPRDLQRDEHIGAIAIVAILHERLHQIERLRRLIEGED